MKIPVRRRPGLARRRSLTRPHSPREPKTEIRLARDTTYNLLSIENELGRLLDPPASSSTTVQPSTSPAEPLVCKRAGSLAAPDQRPARQKSPPFLPLPGLGVRWIARRWQVTRSLGGRNSLGVLVACFFGAQDPRPQSDSFPSLLIRGFASAGKGLIRLSNLGKKFGNPGPV